MFEGGGSSVMDFQAMSDEGLIEALRTAHGAAAAAQAAEVFAVRELYRRHRAASAEPGPGGVRAGEFAATEAAMAVQVDEGSVAAMIDVGLALEGWLPRTRAEFAAGRIDLAKVRVVIDSTRAVAREVLDELEPRLLETATRTTPVRLRQTARRWVARLDPVGAQRRRERRQDDRDVRIRAIQDSMAVFDGVLPAPGAQTVAMRLREMSLQVCSADPRTMPQRRADALVALADGSGRLRCTCGRGERCPKREVAQPPRRPLIQIGIPADTLLGMTEAPAFLAGYGPIDAALARMVAEHARFQVIPERSDAEEPVAAEQVAHTPRLAREVRALDGMCRFPNCVMSAAESELAHHRSPATRADVTTLCTRHHRLKVLVDKRKVPWETWLAEADRLQWTTPTGAQQTTAREGARYLFPHNDSDAPTAQAPIVEASTRSLADDIAYPLRGHVLVHRQLCRITPEDEIPDDTATPAVDTAY
ncbi:DUF222 domain-containing protein [Nocardia brasiliensis]|uniref:DUF222 domain-containing protein n=1 Tax=Nocardia brasiliensis TaxID=37326 RepID=UPI0018933C6B|nr:DUF222 domain-containing protein [Nocardia brasiliensis]MBF6130186.1 DUF222 domain-containing protein [Nocardia brasiliensis]